MFLIQGIEFQREWEHYIYSDSMNFKIYKNKNKKMYIL